MDMMDIDSEILMDLCNRAERITEEMGRINRALVAVKEGKPLSEAFDEDLYLESYQSDLSRVITLVRKLMIKLIRVAYIDPRDHCSCYLIFDEISNIRDEIIDITRWNTKKNRIIDMLHDDDLRWIFDRAIERFKNMVDERPWDYSRDIVYDSALSYNVVPWTINGLLGDDVEKLLEDLLRGE